MFVDGLEIKLRLTVGKKDFTVPGGHVKTLKLDLQPCGFICLLSFAVDSQEHRRDELFPIFIKSDLMKVRLEVKSRWEEQKTKSLLLHGLVTDKDILAEYVPEEVKVKGDPILYRHYRIAFADPAQPLFCGASTIPAIY
jgi:hypothetical protein